MLATGQPEWPIGEQPAFSPQGAHVKTTNYHRRSAAAEPKKTPGQTEETEEDAERALRQQEQRGPNSP